MEQSELKTLSRPWPGTRTAYKKGCLCPRMENDYGQGKPIKYGVGFVIKKTCPWHGTKKGSLFQWVEIEG